MSDSTTTTGQLLLVAGLAFHSGRRLADYPGLIAAVEAEARTPLGAEIARLLREASARALDALTSMTQAPHCVTVVIDTLRAALAQPEDDHE